MEPPIGAYSHVARIPLTGADLLIISGQLATDLDNPDLIAQTEQAMEQIRLAVESFGGSMADVVKLTTFVTEIARRDELRALRVRYFGDRLPASTLVRVGGLVDARALVEIEASAVVANEP
jgi:enamine deaminase RidA (YjgF/YER057c/UK114 family)